tara:strand:- start:724 stop:867 length:144 start_codon:yes stop_codon:yes gene_type:complete
MGNLLVYAYIYYNTNNINNTNNTTEEHIKEHINENELHDEDEIFDND